MATGWGSNHKNGRKQFSLFDDAIQEDFEMDECDGNSGSNPKPRPNSAPVTTTTGIENEDPESRDSGVSLGGQSIVSITSSISQGTLINAIDNVLEISGRREPPYKHFHTPLKQRSFSSNALTAKDPLENFYEEDTADVEAFQQFYGESPLKKKQRRSNGLQGPLDFSSLYKQQQNQSTSTSSSTLGTLLNVSDNDIPVSARSIQRVHSASVLESNRSFGSPEALERYSLRTVDRPSKESRAFRSIDAETLVVLLESMTEEQFNKRFILIDCRYPYEFEGGHILYSKNIYEVEDIINLFYPDNVAEISQQIPIFYCEFSQKRGPKMAHALREYDRNLNENRYPYVDYKEIYLLDRGYRHFFEERQYSKFCLPQAYIRMWDQTFADERKKYDGHRRNTTKKRRRRL